MGRLISHAADLQCGFLQTQLKQQKSVRAVLGAVFSSQFLAGMGRLCFTRAVTEKLLIPVCISQTHAEKAQHILCAKPIIPAEMW